MRRLSLLLAIVITSALGCDAAADVLSPRELRDLAAARARWNGSALRQAYSYESRRSCFCPPEYAQWHRVTVMNGVVTDVRDAAGVPVPAAQRAWYPTIDGLFEILLGEPDENMADLAATYDAQHGYPLTIDIVGKPTIADYGATYYSRNLQPAPVP